MRVYPKTLDEKIAAAKKYVELHDKFKGLCDSSNLIGRIASSANVSTSQVRKYLNMWKDGGEQALIDWHESAAESRRQGMKKAILMRGKAQSEPDPEYAGCALFNKVMGINARL